MKTLITSPDLKTALLHILLLLSMTHALVPFLTATFGSEGYFQLQTLKQASINEARIITSSEKELNLMLDLEKTKLDFALKLATLDASTKLKSLDLLFKHEFAMQNLTVNAPIIELEVASKHIIGMARIEQETKRLWSKDWKEVESKKIELGRYKERGVMLKKMLEKWAPGDFEGQGFIERFMKEDEGCEG